jgi:hypothetical protein
MQLAGSLFVEVARRWPASVFAPKAIVAAMTLLPERRDSLGDWLNDRYGQSPYAIALRGETAAAFPAAEDSLARALGIQLAVEARPAGAARVAAPTPGRRTVWFDPPPPARAAPAASTAPESRAPKAVPARPQQRPGERPTERP